MKDDRRVVSIEQVQAALDFMDGTYAAKVYHDAEMAKLKYEKARAEAEESFTDGTVKSRENRAILLSHIYELAEAKIVAGAEFVKWKYDWGRSDHIIELYRTDSANQRQGLI